MKTIKQISIAFAFALISTLSSCSSDSGSGGSGPASGSFVNAKVAGSNFSATGSLAIGNYASGNLVLQGTTAAGKSIAINLYAFDGTLETGTYNVSDTSTDDTHTGSLSFIEVNTGTMTSITYNSAICTNASGTITITFIDATKIEGTFSFTGKELRDGDDCSGATKNVTNGSFRLVL